MPPATTAIRPANFREEVIEGLSAPHKRLSSKYFYDAVGDKLFQQIMRCDEYYLTRSELEILSEQSRAIASTLLEEEAMYDVVELGAGDATKSIYLLQALNNARGLHTYYPIDISANVIAHLERTLPAKLRDVDIVGMNGEYMPMLERVMAVSNRPKILLFMGANIGNMLPAEAVQFCTTLGQHMSANDKLLIGFDLKKNPQTILAAYNDSAGITKAFNLNLLSRINRELDGDFDITGFAHYPTYDPGTGACRSYLMSLRRQTVHIGEHTFTFEKDEPIYTEISQKYSANDILELANASGFVVEEYFYDSARYFTDMVWTPAK